MIMVIEYSSTIESLFDTFGKRGNRMTSWRV